MIQVTQGYTLIMHKFNDNLFKNILVFFQMESKIKKATGGVNLVRKLNLLLPRLSLLTIYKCFIRPHLEYGNVIYD